MIAVILILLSFAAGWLADVLRRRKICKRLSDLTGTVAQVTCEQDFGIRVATAGHDPLAKLSEGFNRMLGEIQENQAKLPCGCGFFSFSVRPSSLLLRAVNAGSWVLSELVPSCLK